MSTSSVNDPNIQLPPGFGIPPAPPDSTEGPKVVPLLTDPTPITDSFGPSAPPVALNLVVPSAPNGVVLPLPEITISQFHKSVTGALNDLRDTIFAAENQNNLTLRNMRLNAILMAQDLAATLARAKEIAFLQQLLYSTQNTAVSNLNGAVAEFNFQMSQSLTIVNGDVNQTNHMNEAIADYNAGNITFLEFLSEANGYNGYATSRNEVIAPFIATFNAAVDLYNSQVTIMNPLIDQINLLRDEAGLPPNIPQVLPYDHATFLPFVTIPAPGELVPFLPDRAPAIFLPLPDPPPSNSDVIDITFTPQFDAQIPPVILFTDYLELVKKYREFVQTVLQSRVKIQPNGYIEPLPAVFFNPGSGSAGAGAGVSLGSVAVGLDARGLEKILGAAIYETAMNKFELPLTARLVATLVLTDLKALSISGLQATIPAMRLVANKLPFINEDKSATDVFLGLNYSNQISNFTASEEHQVAIRGYVRLAHPELDDSRLKQVAGALTAGLNLSLLQFATFELSQTLGIPGLSAQLIANDSGQPVQDIIQQFRGPSTPADVFQNSVSIASLKADLANQLATSDALSVENRNSLINAAVNHANAIKKAESAEALQASLIQALQIQGITKANAERLADEAASFLKAENLGLYLLDTEINRKIITQRTLRERLIAEGIDESIAKTTIANVQIKESKSLRNLRDRVANELVTQNVQREEALIAATRAVIGDQIPPAPPLISPNALAEQISEKVVAKLSPTIGVFEAQNVANQLNIVLFGPAQGTALVNEEIQSPTSIRNQIIDQIHVLSELKDEKVDAALQDMFRDFNKPNFDLYTFTRRLMDPANTLIHSMWTGAMYQGQGDFPSNFQRTVDVII